MSRVKIDDFEKYEVSTNTNRTNFFNLENDGDSAVVRFMYEGLDEIEGVAVHTVSVDGRDRKIACLREYGDPIGNCPFCEAKLNVSPRLFLELKQYERTADGRALRGNASTAIWERGRSFIKKLTALAINYQPLCDYFFIITRCGKKGDAQTTYEILEYRGDTSKVTDMSLPEEPYDAVGSLVWDKNYSEMKEYLVNGTFPQYNSGSDEGVVRREVHGSQSASQPISRPVAESVPEQSVYNQTSQPAEPVRRRRI